MSTREQEEAQVTAKDIHDAGLVVEKARERYREALEAERAARHDTTNTLNALNEATKKFDVRLAEFRRTVPRGADWNAPEMAGAVG